MIVNTLRGLLEVTDIRRNTVTGKLLDAQKQIVLSYNHPVYVCVSNWEVLNTISL